ncbi:HD domain-containing protein [Paraliobacillus sp. X-1268]|uniref:HD domain-containing protein n=1 Tax=Paraliobacillus sp. X-1268 TaxID=2213193 RepID=UPI000E3D0032|nr:HD domain-containing protein [Paraliobacillus sp. X-1268]
MPEDTTYFYQFVPITYSISAEKKQEILESFPPPNLPNGESFFNIQEEEQGTKVKERLLLNDFEVKLTKTNKQYLRLSFSNNNGMIQAKMWDNQGAITENLPLLEKYTVFDIEGVVDAFLGNKSVTIQKIQVCKEEVNPFTLLPYTQQSLEDLTTELFAYLSELSDPYKEIAFAAMRRFWKDFRMAPAAKGYHHNYLGGLLKHTVGLMRFARYITTLDANPFQATIKLINVVEKAYKNELWSNFQDEIDNQHATVWKDTIDHLYHMLQGMMKHHETPLNADLLITSILYHDIGKLLEYDYAGKSFEPFSFLYPTADMSITQDRKQAGITMDPLGVLVGHIPYGVLLLTKVIETDKIVVPIEAIHNMSHCILCHHGLPEWGAAVRQPQTMEGYIIHIVDYLDSRYENTEKIK